MIKRHFNNSEGMFNPSLLRNYTNFFNLYNFFKFAFIKLEARITVTYFFRESVFAYMYLITVKVLQVFH